MYKTNRPTQSAPGQSGMLDFVQSDAFQRGLQGQRGARGFGVAPFHPFMIRVSVHIIQEQTK